MDNTKINNTEISQEPKITKKVRRNQWIISTYVLGILCLILFASIELGIDRKNIGDIIKGNSQSAWDKYVESGLTVDCKTERETNNLCFVAKGIPSWIVQGQIVAEGYSDFNNESSHVVVDSLIANQVILVYHGDCPACQKQINYFNGE